MNLNLIKSFVYVIEEGNFSRAATRLHLSQPAVSMQMQSLAQEMGVELLRRVGHRIEPTEAGALLYRQSKEILGTWQQTMNQLEGLSQRLKGRLELGASTVPGDYLLPPLLCQFYQLHPEIEVRMKVAPTEEILADLTAGRLDLAVIGSEPDGSLNSQVLFKDKLVAVFSPDYALAKRKTLNAQDLWGQPLLQRSNGSATRLVLERALVKAGHNPGKLRVAMELGSSRALLEAAAQGLGLAVVSRFAAQDYTQQGRLECREIADLELERSFWLVEGRTTPVSKAFLNYLQRGEKVG